MKNILYFFKEQFRSIRNLIVWFPVIWNDRQWDHVFFLEILDKKLREMERFYRGRNAHHLYAYSDADNIHKCFLATRRLLEDNYLTEAERPFLEKFPDYHLGLTIKDNENGMCQFVNNNPQEQIDLHQKCFIESEKMREDDYDELFAQLRLHIEDWWD